MFNANAINKDFPARVGQDAQLFTNYKYEFELKQSILRPRDVQCNIRQDAHLMKSLLTTQLHFLIPQIGWKGIKY